MTELFSYGPRNFGDFLKKNHRAILLTIIFHLIILIILVLAKVEGLKNDMELGVKIDFEEEIDIEELTKDDEIEVPTEWLQQVYEARQQASNRAVNLNDEVNKEISTDDYVNELLSELESQRDPDLSKDLEKWKEILSEDVKEEDYTPEEISEEETPYTGATTITYEFKAAPKDRKKRTLVVPVYRCEGSALVIVEATVRKDGSVSDVKVLSTESINNPSCFIEAAENAALSSKFNSSLSAPERHKVQISYQFIAQ